MSALRPSTSATSGDDLMVVNGPDTVGGGLGDDIIDVSDGLGLWDGPFNADIHSLVNGNKGDDTIFGSSTTSDTLLGGQGDDSITDSFGADVLNGNLGDDVLVSGLPGDDVLIGGPVGSPILLGEGGSDTLIAHDSGVTFSGGEDADLLVFDLLPRGSTMSTGVILDWDPGDRLSVTRFGDRPGLPRADRRRCRRRDQGGECSDPVRIRDRRGAGVRRSLCLCSDRARRRG
jgi:Ca2+-binding RTX toxin-like protein